MADKAILLKLFLFLGIFLSTPVVEEYLWPSRKSSSPIFTIFTRDISDDFRLIPYITKQVVFYDFKGFLVLLFKVLLASFLKDMIVAVCSPSIFSSPVSERLLNKVENATLDISWLPESDELKKMRIQRRKLVKAQQKHNLIADSGDQLSEFSELDEMKGHTFVYDYGHVGVDRSVQLGHKAAKSTINFMKYIQGFFEAIISKFINFVLFTLRTLVCSLSSIILLFLYAIQLKFRVIKLIYNFFEKILTFCCSCVNDASLLAIEVIHKVKMEDKEDAYANLKKSVENFSGDHPEESVNENKIIPKKTSTPKFGPRITKKKIEISDSDLSSDLSD